MNICLLFEQSGTFKNACVKYGHNAIDIDIVKTQYTDYNNDIFKEIENGEINKYNEYDFIIAFYPCTWFSVQNDFIYNRSFNAFRNWDNERIDNYIIQRRKEYERAKHCLIELVRQINKPLIIENPRSHRIIEILGEPQIYIKNRVLYGDILKKPTFFYCYNGASVDMKILTNEKQPTKTINHMTKKDRSLISSKFAENFINNIKIVSRETLSKELKL